MGILSRRRTFLIDRRFQLKYTSIIVFVGVAVSALLGFFIYRLSLENTKILQLDPEFQENVLKFDTAVMFYLAGFIGLMALSLFFWGVFVTHRVAGPIFIVSNFLKQLADNQVPSIRSLRKGDELREFFDSFTAMVETLKRQNGSDAENFYRWAGKLRELGNEKASGIALELERLAEKKKIWMKSS